METKNGKTRLSTGKQGKPGQENKGSEENKETEDRWTGKLRIEKLVNSTLKQGNLGQKTKELGTGKQCN